MISSFNAIIDTITFWKRQIQDDSSVLWLPLRPGHYRWESRPRLEGVYTERAFQLLLNELFNMVHMLEGWHIIYLDRDRRYIQMVTQWPPKLQKLAQKMIMIVFEPVFPFLYIQVTGHWQLSPNEVWCPSTFYYLKSLCKLGEFISCRLCNGGPNSIYYVCLSFESLFNWWRMLCWWFIFRVPPRHSFPIIREKSFFQLVEQFILWFREIIYILSRADPRATEFIFSSLMVGGEQNYICENITVIFVTITNLWECSLDTVSSGCCIIPSSYPWTWSWPGKVWPGIKSWLRPLASAYSYNKRIPPVWQAPFCHSTKYFIRPWAYCGCPTMCTSLLRELLNVALSQPEQFRPWPFSRSPSSGQRL